jgi:SAM-dependent methyltransferase
MVSIEGIVEYGLTNSDTRIWNLTSRMCLRMFSRYLPTLPTSILDIGCGTGRDLYALSRICSDCWGVDYLPEIIESARAKLPHIKFIASDMLDIRLGRTFDVIICMGSGFMYAKSKEDVAKMLRTFVAHAHTGTLLILDALNASSFSDKEEFSMNFKSVVSSSMWNFDGKMKTLVRRRTWSISGQAFVEDCCQYKAFFPNEIKHLLTDNGFRVVGIFDNMDLRGTNLSGLKLYISSVMCHRKDRLRV